MSNSMPQGWTAALLDEVTHNVRSGFASGNKNVHGGLSHLRMNNIGIGGELVLDLVRAVPPGLAKPHYLLNPGDVLVCTTNSTKLVGKCAFFDLIGRYVFSNHLTRLRPVSQLVDGKFLHWKLWTLWRSGSFDEKCKHWVNQSTLPKEELLNTPVLIPPLPEQRRIVAKLEKLLEKVDSCQKRLAKIPILLKRFRQSVLEAAFSGRLSADWREKNPDVEAAGSLITRIREMRLRKAQTNKERSQIQQAFRIEDPGNILEEVDFDRIPDSWIACRIGSIGTVVNGSTPSRKDLTFWNGEIPWVSSGEVSNSFIRATRERITNAGFDSCSVRLLPPGTVLLAMIGEGKTRGQTAVLKYTPQ